MQFKFDEFDPEEHDLFKALTVKQPWASALCREYDLIPGIADKSIELRTMNTKYRGDLMICSSQIPVISGLQNGCTIGLVELYDVKKVEDFTPWDWECAMFPGGKGVQKKYRYGWMMRNPRQVIEFPVSGQLGLWNLVFTKDLIIEYPRYVKI